MTSWTLSPCAELSTTHAAAWDALVARCGDTPFLRSDFLLPALAEFGSGREWLARAVGPGGELLAAALVRPAGRGMWETFQPSQLPLGAWVAPEGAPSVELARSLLGRLPGLALGLGLTQLDPRLNPRPADGPGWRTLDYIATSFVDIEGPFDAYWDARGKNLRQNTRKQRNKLAAEGTEATLQTVTDPAGVAEALAAYGTMEAAGWKAGGGTAIHPDNAQGRFYRAMLERFCARGNGRIVLYRFGAEVVAADLCIDNGPLVVVLKTAYDEKLKSVSPSTLMRQDEFALWWGEGRYRRIEFYGKTMEWHTRWTASERTLYHLNVYRWPWLKGLHEQLQRRRAGAAGAPPAATTAVAEPG
jgi:CelD/BcsL family acetyltransferase involved in cellulose biosynthesis